MYSVDQMQHIVEHFREHRQPSHINTTADVKRFPNEVLLNYLISGEVLDSTELAGILETPAELEIWLGLYSSEAADNLTLPGLPFGISYEDDVEVISYALQKVTGKFSMADGNQLLFADAIPMEHEYPSGLRVPYYSLINEQSANVSTFGGGYGNLTSGEVYVRANFATAMNALCIVAESDGLLPQYRQYMIRFSAQLPGIVISHELCEISNVNSGRSEAPGIERELQSEDNARDFLIDNGVDMNYYGLYHLLRASQDDTGGPNVSQDVVDQILMPFF